MHHITHRFASWKTKHPSRFSLLCLACVLLLAACQSGATAAPTATNQPLPTSTPSAIATVTVTNTPTVEPTTVVASEGRLLYVRSGNLWLWDNGTTRQLTNSGDLYQPAWSPDGTRIAAVQRRESSSDLVLLPASGSSQDLLTDNGPDAALGSRTRVFNSIWAFYPAWSPDGETIAYASQCCPPSTDPTAEYRMVLYTIASDGSSARQRGYASNGGHVGRVVYTADGAALILSFAPVDGTPMTLVRYSSAAGAKALEVPENSYDPAISPDGTWLAMAVRGETGTDIYLMSLAGGEVTRLTTLDRARAPVWSPDGKQLAFLAIPPGAAGFDLYRIDLNLANGTPQVSAPERLTTDAQIDGDSGLSWAS